MVGLGQQYMSKLPIPKFSSNNPYWKNPAELWGWLRPEYRPRLSARDFLYATTWEIYKWDVHGAHLVRQATIRTIRINFRFEVWASVNRCLAQQREKKDEKAVSRIPECSDAADASRGNTAGGTAESSV